jgi:multiple sugar transport system ATP-binding protein
MTDLLDRRPSQLSGGQRQRVAIGRAMVRDPSVFLFDEPLSNLDAQLRTQMRLEIKKLHQRVGATMIFVTHDQVEAMTMADRIVIMKDGFIQQTGTPEQVYHSPANVFVAQFIGAPSMNLMPVRIEGGRLFLPGGGIFEMPLADAAGMETATLGIRPSDLSVLSEDDSRAAVFEGVVSVIEPLGSETLVHVSAEGRELVAQASGRHPPAPGQSVRLWADPAETHLFDTITEVALHG